MAFPGPFEGKLEEGSRAADRRFSNEYLRSEESRNVLCYEVWIAEDRDFSGSLDRSTFRQSRRTCVVVWEVWYYGSGAWCCLRSYDIPYCQERITRK